MLELGRATVLLGALSAAVCLSSCASLFPPERAIYAGKDYVSVAHPEQIVGIWRVTELNPLRGTAAQETIIEYSANGQVRSTVRSQLPENPNTTADIAMTLVGQWSLEGDVVTHRNIVMTSADNSALSQMLADTFNDQPKSASAASILELEVNRMVMIGRDGEAMEYLRKR